MLSTHGGASAVSADGLGNKRKLWKLRLGGGLRRPLLRARHTFPLLPYEGADTLNRFCSHVAAVPKAADECWISQSPRAKRGWPHAGRGKEGVNLCKQGVSNAHGREYIWINPKLQVEISSYSQFRGHGISNAMDEWRKRIADRMEEVGVTAAQLTRAAKVGPTMIHDILNRGANPSIQNLAKIAKALGTTVAFLYEGHHHVGTLSISLTGVNKRVETCSLPFKGRKEPRFH